VGSKKTISRRENGERKRSWSQGRARKKKPNIKESRRGWGREGKENGGEGIKH